MQCECPRHEKHIRDFIKKNLGADGKFGIVDVEPGKWLINLEHPEKNTGSLLPVMLRTRGYQKSN